MPAVVVNQVEHRYGDRPALSGVSFEVGDKQIFGLLGPNGSGKTTLFRILSTLMPLQTGQALVCGKDVKSDPDGVRRQIGVTFQAPSLDVKLTVRENLMHQGHLYGLSGKVLKDRSEYVLDRLGVASRANDYAETLSGGLKRRVEIAKCLLHSPKVLLLDEPSTGLDPSARHELWNTLESLNREHNVTILVTTHLMEEANRCHQLALLDEGKLIAQGTPDQLQSMVGGDSLTIQSDDPDRLAKLLQEKLNWDVQRVGAALRIEHARGHELVTQLATEFPGEFRSLVLGKPTLDDVFIKLTGRNLASGVSYVKPSRKKKR